MKKHPADGAHARARSLRQSMTEAERRFWQILRSHQMNAHKFRRQVPSGRYIADFVCHEARLIVEIDGGQHDRSSPRRRASDDRRRAGPHHPHPNPPPSRGGLLPMNNLRSKNS
jgi:very-short-patch-repair endonuclease